MTSERKRRRKKKTTKEKEGKEMIVKESERCDEKRDIEKKNRKR